MAKSLSFMLIALVALLAAGMIYGFSAQTGSSVEEQVRPLTTDSLARADTAAFTTWLHVEVETNWGWFWQKSTGLAYTTHGRNGPKRVPVGMLCIQLRSHKVTKQCMPDTDSIRVSETVRGLGVPKTTAWVKAWTQNPELGPDSVSLNP
jgi:hypothetical protein